MSIQLRRRIQQQEKINPLFKGSKLLRQEPSYFQSSQSLFGGVSLIPKLSTKTKEKKEPQKLPKKTEKKEPDREAKLDEPIGKGKSDIAKETPPKKLLDQSSGAITKVQGDIPKGESVLETDDTTSDKRAKVKARVGKEYETDGLDIEGIIKREELGREKAEQEIERLGEEIRQLQEKGEKIGSEKLLKISEKIDELQDKRDKSFAKTEGIMETGKKVIEQAEKEISKTGNADKTIEEFKQTTERTIKDIEKQIEDEQEKEDVDIEKLNTLTEGLNIQKGLLKTMPKDINDIVKLSKLEREKEEKARKKAEREAEKSREKELERVEKELKEELKFQEQLLKEEEEKRKQEEELKKPEPKEEEEGDEPEPEEGDEPEPEPVALTSDKVKELLEDLERPQRASNVGARKNIRSFIKSKDRRHTNFNTSTPYVNTQSGLVKQEENNKKVRTAFLLYLQENEPENIPESLKEEAQKIGKEKGKQKAPVVFASLEKPIKDITKRDFNQQNFKQELERII
jgi:hypothetical protein